MRADFADSFLILPDDAFFVKALAAGAELSDADAKAMGETYLEENSPISMENLLWGVARSGSKILVYAAAAEKFRKDEAVSGKLKEAAFAMPLCAIIAGAKLPQDAWTAYFGDGFVSAFRTQGAEIADFVSCRTDEARSDSDNLKTLAEKFGIEKCSLYALTEAKEAAFSVSFRMRAADGGAAIVWKKRASVLRGISDVRPAELLRAAAKKRMRAASAAFCAWAVCATFALLCVWQISLFFKQAEAESLQAEMDELLPHSKKIEKMSEQLAFLKTFSEDTLYNVWLLGVINKDRPSQVEFTRSAAKSASQITVSGKADSIDTVNKYADLLAANPLVKKVENVIPVSKSGSTQFTMTITFNKK